MRRVLAAVGVATALVLLASGCGRDPVPRVGVTRIAAADRQPAPPISGNTLDGRNIALSDFAGRIVVINSWASWCAPCRSEVPILVAAAQAQGEGVAFVGLNVSDEPEAAGQFVAETGMTFPSIADPDGALLATIPGVPPKALPSTVVLDAQGRIAARVVGEVTAADLDSILADLKAQS